MMADICSYVRLCLECVRHATETEFAAVALSGPGARLRWLCAAGSRNGRYKRIILSSGKGVIGRALSSGRPAVVRRFLPKSGDDPSEYSVLLAEGLVSVVAVPVVGDGRVIGVLAAGNRKEREFCEESIRRLCRAAEKMAPLLAGRSYA